MSEPRLISPLLDTILMGDPISCHDGIQCCPAMDKNTEEKYIVKIISVPASQTQLDALLLTGALTNNEEAWTYFENRAEEIGTELDRLQEFSRLEGFLPASGYQIVPMEHDTGYEVYILTSYRRSLERHMEKVPMTQLAALNLALDVCAALTAARRNGYLFVNLKPSNVFIGAAGEFKIGDLGLMKTDSLHYATIADHYISQYTPPEITDAFSKLNTTMDVYAIGRILYQIYNGGELPADKVTHTAPAYADDELAQIILKALAPDSAERIQTPAELGQLLVSYIQKNGIEDCPIIPAIDEASDEIANTQSLTNDNASQEEIAPELMVDSNNDEPAPSEEPATAEDGTSADEQITSTFPDTVSTDDVVDDTTISDNADSGSEAAENSENPVPPQDDSVEAVPQTVGVNDESIADDITSVPDDDTIADDISYSEVSTEVGEILAQADELAAMEVPDPVVAPDPVPVELPPTENDSTSLPDETEEAAQDNATLSNTEDIPVADEIEEPEEPAKTPFRWQRLIAPVIAILVLIGGFLFYRFYVMQSIEDIQVIGSKDQLTVVLTTKVDESLLTISCTDIYGKKIIVPVLDGRADFTGLLPDTEYTVQAHIDGLHVLTGKTEATYFTPTETSIVQFSVVTGNFPGTAILSFTVSGPDSDSWKFTYATNVGKENTVTFEGNTVTLTGLEENKFYSGNLEPVDDLFITELPEITFTANEIIQAGDLTFTDCTDGKLSVAWTAPESVIVESWTVHCFNGKDFDETQTVTQTQATFTVPDNRDSFTVEVTASGQSVSQRVTLGENSVTIKTVTSMITENGKIELQWEPSREIQDGWIIAYTVNDSETVFNIPANDNSVLIAPVLPNSTYIFTVLAADTTATVCPPHVLQTEEATDFQVNYHGNPVTKNNLHFSMCSRPGMSWSHQNLDYSDYTNTFTVGQLAGFVIFLDRRYDISDEEIVTAFVIEDENGQIISIDTSTSTWSNMWYKNYCQLNIPTLPDTPGNYIISIYFNGQFANKQAFSVVNP